MVRRILRSYNFISVNFYFERCNPSKHIEDDTVTKIDGIVTIDMFFFINFHDDVICLIDSTEFVQRLKLFGDGIGIFLNLRIKLEQKSL